MKETPKRLAIVHEEFYALTGDYFEALVLGQMNLYQTWTHHIDKFIEQENARSQAPETSEAYISPTEGWFYKTLDELCEELMHPFSRATAQRIIQKLIDSGWVKNRFNPCDKRDRTKWYRLDLVRISAVLREKGYTIPLWGAGKLVFVKEANLGARSSSSQRETPISHAETPVSHRETTIPKEPTKESPKKKNPQPFAEQREPEFFPQTTKGERARLPNGRTDYPKTIRDHDPLGSVIPEIFPNFKWEERIDTARYYVRARENGKITDKGLRMLRMFYRTQVFTDVQDWRTPDPKELLQKKFPLAVQAIGEHIAGELSILNGKLKGCGGDPEFFLEQSRHYVDGHGLEDNFIPPAYDHWAVVLVRYARRAPMTVTPKYRTQISKELKENFTILPYLKGRVELPDVYGITEAEILQAREVWKAELTAKKEELKKFL